jgi:hemerythrin superfamily protein
MSKDVLDLLEADHKSVETLFAQFDDIPSGDRDGYFSEVVHTLVGHEVAEELVVYPALREDPPDGDEIADARLAEQADAEQLLSEMESNETSSGAFTAQFKKLRESVLAHAKAEEATVFPLLKDSTTVEDRRELGERYAKAKENAPTHPHPHAPDTPPGNKALGPIAAIFDKTRDAINRAA